MHVFNPSYTLKNIARYIPGASSLLLSWTAFTCAIVLHAADLEGVSPSCSKGRKTGENQLLGKIQPNPSVGEMADDQTRISVQWMDADTQHPLLHLDSDYREMQQGLTLGLEYQAAEWLSVRCRNYFAHGTMHQFDLGEWKPQENSVFLDRHFRLEAGFRPTIPVEFIPALAFSVRDRFSEDGRYSPDFVEQRAGVRATAQIARPTRLTLEASKGNTLKTDLPTATQLSSFSAALNQQVLTPLSLFSTWKTEARETDSVRAETVNRLLECGISVQLAANTRASLGRNTCEGQVFNLDVTRQQDRRVSFGAGVQQSIASLCSVEGRVDREYAAAYRHLDGKWTKTNEATQWSMGLTPSLAFGDWLSVQIGYQAVLLKDQDPTLKKDAEHRASVGLKLKY